MENVLVSTLPCRVCSSCQVHSPKPAGLPLKSGYMPTIVQLLNIILYNDSMALGFSYLSLPVRKSGCFKPQRRMPFKMSALNQNKRLSRLAIISKHVAADKRKRFGTVWVDFCQGEFSFSIAGSFFLYLFIPSKCNPFFFAHCVSFACRAVYSESH